MDDPKMPEFPREFILRHCPQAMEHRDLMNQYGREPLTEEEQLENAECAFSSAGAGLACEACDLHLTRPYCGHKLDEEWLPKIEQYYRDAEAYWEWKQKQDSIAAMNGAYI